jgi:16S rRNA C967 or C1407 C5-methylase (RsmB/RsmF family)/NOL1/NOP2/fmu family ribosome biogenesis protein
VGKLPESLLDSLEGIKGFNRETFERVHEESNQITSIRINPAKWSIPEEIKNVQISPIHDSRFTIHDPVPWSQYGYYLSSRPSFTFDPLFHAGCYYVQEASSMFLEQALKQLADLSQPLKVLDLCAAPGGKSTHIQSLISQESLLVSNEVIKSRSNILKDNLVKWGSQNVILTNNDPSAFQRLTGYFDIIVTDAPCSGSGLFRRDEQAINEWSLNNVQLCCQRQQRILADVLPSLKENGLLIYSTCSYSMDEDEDIADWLVNEMDMKNERLEFKKEWGIVESLSKQTESVGYRFYPDKVKGEGLFLSCFRKQRGTVQVKIKPARIEKATVKEESIIPLWLKGEAIELIKANIIFAIPSFLINDYAILRAVLNIQYMGTGLGQVMKDKLVPDHSLALSTVISDQIPAIDLPFEDVIRYLQRQDLTIQPSIRGWQLIRYQNHNLGWVNVLPNRINNYYPKDLRILKQSFER